MNYYLEVFVALKLVMSVLLQLQDDSIKGEYVLLRTCWLWDCINLLGFAEQRFLAA